MSMTSFFRETASTILHLFPINRFTSTKWSYSLFMFVLFREAALLRTIIIKNRFNFSIVNMSLITWLYRVELPLLASLQTWPVFNGSGWISHIWLTATTLGDPKLSFTTYFPLFYGLNRKMGSLVLIAAACSEFLNGVFKW